MLARVAARSIRTCTRRTGKVRNSAAEMFSQESLFGGGTDKCFRVDFRASYSVLALLQQSQPFFASNLLSTSQQMLLQPASPDDDGT
mmetsp:Transcript_20423/g.28294  ORF Transcript_20423/g.28294 Transcript_20423/m.28294 type:complete len:87 (+) Transcript_20423:181-441(+)